MNGPPDFYLTAVAETGQGHDLARVRSCWTKGRMRSPFRDDHILVIVDPPVIGRPYGLEGEDITHLIITTRWRGYTLFPVTEWGCSVYVSRVLDEEIIGSLSITRADQTRTIAWANVYRTREDAEAEVERRPISYP